MIDAASAASFACCALARADGIVRPPTAPLKSSTNASIAGLARDCGVSCSSLSRGIAASKGGVAAGSAYRRAPSFERFIADRGYDANNLSAVLAAKYVDALIKSIWSRTAPISYDPADCRTRISSRGHVVA